MTDDTLAPYGQRQLCSNHDIHYTRQNWPWFQRRVSIPPASHSQWYGVRIMQICFYVSQGLIILFTCFENFLKKIIAI